MNAPLSIRPPSGTVARGGTNAPLPIRDRCPRVTILSIVAPVADHRLAAGHDPVRHLGADPHNRVVAQPGPVPYECVLADHDAAEQRGPHLHVRPVIDVRAVCR